MSVHDLESIMPPIIVTGKTASPLTSATVMKRDCGALNKPLPTFVVPSNCGLCISRFDDVAFLTAAGAVCAGNIAGHKATRAARRIDWIFFIKMNYLMMVFAIVVPLQEIIYTPADGAVICARPSIIEASATRRPNMSDTTTCHSSRP